MWGRRRRVIGFICNIFIIPVMIYFIIMNIIDMNHGTTFSCKLGFTIANFILGTVVSFTLGALLYPKNIKSIVLAFCLFMFCFYWFARSVAEFAESPINWCKFAYQCVIIIVSILIVIIDVCDIVDKYDLH